MSDTSKREELIRALAADVHQEDGWLSDAQTARLQWDATTQAVHFHGEGSLDVGHIVAIAEDVFEQAHTPTDDEREATAKAIRLSLRFELGWSADEARTLGAVLAEPVATRLAALRRTAVQEPSAEESKALEAVRGWTQSSGPGVRVLRVLLSMAERSVNQGGSDDAKR